MLALLTQLLDLVGRGVIVHMLLIGSGFDGWHGLFVAHPFFGPMADFRPGLAGVDRGRPDARPGGSCAGATSSAPPVASAGHCRSGSWPSTVAVIAALALTAGLGPGAVTANRVAASVGATFNNVTLLQQALIGRYAPPSGQLRVLPNCNKRGAADAGPGDWLCNLYVYVPQPKSVPFQQINVEYDVSVQYNGCWKASSRTILHRRPDDDRPGRAAGRQPAVRGLRLLQRAVSSWRR